MLKRLLTGRVALLLSLLVGMDGIVTQASGQVEPSILERIQRLEVDSLHAGIRVYHSPGYEVRAEAVGRQIAASNLFFRESLGADAEIALGLLDTTDFQRAFPDGYPYGLPFIDDHVAVMPADLSSGAVIEMYAPFESTASEEIVASLQTVGLTYAEAKLVMVDLIGLHEVGHAQVSAYGIDAKQRWFNEFLASYFGYAYMRSREPDMAVVWDAVTQAGRDGYDPTYSSLDDLNRLYAGVGVGDYVWYQNMFQAQIRAVYDLQGVEFLRRVRDRLSDPEWNPETAEELLMVLEEIAPGFLGWADLFAPARQSLSTTDRVFDLPAFARALDSLRSATGIPGLSAAVIKDGEVIFAHGSGYADLERQIPATPETPYDIASVTKPISAVVALRLVEEGLLDLDRPMAEYNPNPVLYSWGSRPMMAATGTSFSRLVEQYVFRPAGMVRSARTHRDLPLREDLAAAIAIPYHTDSAGTMVRSPEMGPQGDGAAGGVISTVLDLARFDVAMERGELISPASYEAMMRSMRSHIGESLPYSVGWFAQRYSGHELRWHSGWWPDAYSALYLKVPEENLSLILLANSEGVWWDNPLGSAQVQQSSFAQAFFRAFL